MNQNPASKKELLDEIRNADTRTSRVSLGFLLIARDGLMALLASTVMAGTFGMTTIYYSEILTSRIFHI